MQAPSTICSLEGMQSAGEAAKLLPRCVSPMGGGGGGGGGGGSAFKSVLCVHTCGPAAVLDGFESCPLIVHLLAAAFIIPLIGCQPGTQHTQRPKHATPIPVQILSPLNPNTLTPYVT